MPHIRPKSKPTGTARDLNIALYNRTLPFVITKILSKQSMLFRNDVNKEDYQLVVIEKTDPGNLKQSSQAIWPIVSRIAIKRKAIKTIYNNG